ncbi:MAG: hypothetical protein ACPG5P_01575 [Saprospiraceae bacterium]
MISKIRMKIDFLGQTIMLIGGLILLVDYSHYGKWLFLLLGIWQVASAAHLLLAHRYINKINFISVFLTVGIGSLIWKEWVGMWAIIPIVSICIWYFYQTTRDTIKVMNRPTSFWNLRF